MKKVLIPTDFTPESLQLIDYAVLNYPDESLEIVLAHGFKTSEFRMDHLHRMDHSVLQKCCNEEFVKAKKNLLKEHYKNIRTIRLEVFSGSTAQAFKNYLSDQKIEDAVICDEQFFSNATGRSFSLIPYIRKHVKHVQEAPLELRENVVREKRFSFLHLF